MPREFQAESVFGRGRYVLERELGRGGMGVVWLARDLELGENVALKFMPPEICSDHMALDDMRRETLKSRRLTHPHIARIHDFSNVEGEAPFISMEYMDGPNLSALQVQQPDRVFRWDYVKPLIRQLCDALQYAHDEQVIHRDLKPGNLMLDGKGRLKLCDFGLAASVSDSMSRASRDLGSSGTPPYMSPQQLNGNPPASSDDIYGLGATIFELLTSKPPFYSGDIPHQIRELAASRIGERLRELGIGNDVPAEAETLVAACLAKDPADRPPSARAVAEAAVATPDIAAEGSGGVDGEEAALVDDVEVPAPTEISDLESGLPPVEPGKRGRIKAIVLGVICLLTLLLLPLRSNRDPGKQGDASAGGLEAALPGDSLEGCVVHDLLESAPADRHVWRWEQGREGQIWRRLADGGIRAEFVGVANDSRKTYLILGGEPVRDFEFGFAFRRADEIGSGADAGIFYRSEPTDGWHFRGMSIWLQGGRGGFWPDRGVGAVNMERVDEPPAIFNAELIERITGSPMAGNRDGGGWAVVLARGGRLEHLCYEANSATMRHFHLELPPGIYREPGVIAIEIWAEGEQRRAFEFDRLFLRRFE